MASPRRHEAGVGRGRLEPEAVERQLSDRTRVVAVSAMSNVLGTVNPVRGLCREARARGIATIRELFTRLGDLS